MEFSCDKMTKGIVRKRFSREGASAADVAKQIAFEYDNQGFFVESGYDGLATKPHFWIVTNCGDNCTRVYK